MRNLIAFLIRNGAWFFFILLEIVCFYLIFQHNTYQQSLYINSSNEFVGRVYSISGSITSYFGLKEDNQQLITQNAELQKKVWNLENYVSDLLADTITTKSLTTDSLSTKDNYEFIIARVINSSITKSDNYITVNKGSRDGIKPDMGVVSQEGMIGIVREVSRNFAVIQTILNSKTNISCKIKGSNNPGTLVWNGKDYRYANLDGFPRHEKFYKGDTVITSGFSSIFPEGVFIGIVEESEPEYDDNFLTLKVKLASDFASLSNVMIISNKNSEERKNLEESIGKQKSNGK